MTVRRVLVVLAVIGALAGGVAGIAPFVRAFDADVPPAKPVVVIDAGHGGRDPGVVVGDVHEADVNLAIAARVRDLLQQTADLEVVMTRGSDVYLSHEDRIEIAESREAVLYISIQANACDYPNVSGIETWVDEKQQPGSESWTLAELIQGSLIRSTQAQDRGVRATELYLRGLGCPAALVETGFLTSRTERTQLLATSYQQTVAEAIAAGIRAMLE